MIIESWSLIEGYESRRSFKTHDHDSKHSFGTTDQAKMMSWSSASIPTGNKSVWINLFFLKVPSTVRKRRVSRKACLAEPGAMNKEWNLATGPLIAGSSIILSSAIVSASVLTNSLI
jgi:hypothetical protein